MFHHPLVIPCLGGMTMLVACGAEMTEKTSANSPDHPAMPPGEKESRTPAQQKLDSHLVIALKKSRGEPPFDKPTSFDPDLAVDAEGKVLVDITATVTPALLGQISSSGGQVLSSFEAMKAVRARLPLTQVESLATLPEVTFIAPAAQASTNAASPGSTAPASGAVFNPSASTPLIDNAKP